MSAKGNPCDNAKVESFFKTLKREEVRLIAPHRLRTPQRIISVSLHEATAFAYSTFVPTDTALLHL